MSERIYLALMAHKGIEVALASPSQPRQLQQALDRYREALDGLKEEEWKILIKTLGGNSRPTNIQ